MTKIKNIKSFFKNSLLFFIIAIGVTFLFIHSEFQLTFLIYFVIGILTGIAVGILSLVKRFYQKQNNSNTETTKYKQLFYAVIIVDIIVVLIIAISIYLVANNVISLTEILTNFAVIAVRILGICYGLVFGMVATYNIGVIYLGEAKD